MSLAYRCCSVLVAFLFVYLAHGDQEEIDPLVGWQTADFYDQVVDILDATRVLTEERVSLESEVHRRLSYQEERVHRLYHVLGQEIGRQLEARGYLQHFERFHFHRYDGEYPVQLRRVAVQNHHGLDAVLTSFVRTESHIQDIEDRGGAEVHPRKQRFIERVRLVLFGRSAMSDREAARMEHLYRGLVETFPLELPEVPEIRIWVMTVRDRFKGVKLCEQTLKSDVVKSPYERQK